MGGFDLYRHLRDEGETVSMLIMTGYPLQDELHQSEIGGTVEWLHKPFTIMQLTAAVRRVLDRAELANRQ